MNSVSIGVEHIKQVISSGLKNLVTALAIDALISESKARNIAADWLANEAAKHNIPVLSLLDIERTVGLIDTLHINPEQKQLAVKLLELLKEQICQK